MSLEAVRAVADAVLYEGYLLYPYRASARKNQSRWQFGVLGPPGAPFAEPPSMSMQCLLRGADPTVTVHLRFLQLQTRTVEPPSPELLSWDEAVEHEITWPPAPLSQLRGTGRQTEGFVDHFPEVVALDHPVTIFGGEDVELVDSVADGRIVRQRWPLHARVRLTATPDGEFRRLSVTVENTAAGPPPDKDTAIRTSFIGTHLILEVHDGEFVSLLDPPAEATEAAARCRQDRCWPVLAGEPGSTGVLLGAPIILYDYPQIAEQSPGDLFDATEIDEILTLRVMTMTDDEKAEARATDPRAAAIIERCDTLSPAELEGLHGIFGETADPSTDSVLIGGVRVARGSIVRVHPSRRADAQDLFFADRLARVTAVMSDVDGGTHVALVLVDDPGADLHDWYGRYLYFAPDELEPVRQEENAP